MKARFLVSLCLSLSFLCVRPPYNTYDAHAATTWVVNNLSDLSLGICTDESCTLRDAITLSASGDTITFSVSGTLNLDLGELTIDKDLFISGPGVYHLIIDGGNKFRVFHILDGNVVTISGLYLKNGTSINGAGIFNEGVLRLDQCTIASNWATGDGGGLYNYHGTVTVNRSAFYDNHAVDFGAGIMNVGGEVNLTNSSFSKNRAERYAGAIYSGVNTILNLTNCTFAINAYGNDAIFNRASYSTAKNIIMDLPDSCNGSFTYGTNNFSTNNSCSPGFSAVTSLQLALDSFLLPIGYMKLGFGSAAIDAGSDDGCPSIDQLGNHRPLDGNGDNIATCDAGAYEYDIIPPTVLSILRTDYNPTSAQNVTFTVTFSEPLIDLDLTDFSLTSTGISGASISRLDISGEQYLVTVITGSGNGTLRLDISSSAVVHDLNWNAMKAIPYTSGEFYEIIKIPFFLPFILN